MKEKSGVKTLITAAHGGGPHPNGYDGCFTRWMDGYCSGHRTANWLNSLGLDHEPYSSIPGITNGKVRENWLISDSHITSVHREKLRLENQIRQLVSDIKACRRRLAEIAKEEKK